MEACSSKDVVRKKVQGSSLACKWRISAIVNDPRDASRRKGDQLYKESMLPCFISRFGIAVELLCLLWIL